MTERQLAALRALDSVGGEWLYTAEVVARMPNSMILGHLNCSLSSRRKTFTANHAGPLLGALARKGYVVRKRGKPGHPGMCSLWKLGPMSDELKEQGIL